jgi:hypothetical protein
MEYEHFEQNILDFVDRQRGRNPYRYQNELFYGVICLLKKDMLDKLSKEFADSYEVDDSWRAGYYALVDSEESITDIAMNVGSQDDVFYVRGLCQLLLHDQIDENLFARAMDGLMDMMEVKGEVVESVFSGMSREDMFDFIRKFFWRNING